MVILTALLVAGTAFAGAPAKPVKAPKPAKPVISPAEETLAVGLAKLRRKHDSSVREAVLGGAEELRDAVSSGPDADRKRLAGRLPGMAQDPFAICRDLTLCREAPPSLHIEDHALADDAFRALARPWIRLQEARGKAVKVVVDPGQGVRLELEDLPRWPVVSLSAAPTPTGGFDVLVEDGAEAAKAFAAERAAVLKDKK